VVEPCAVFAHGVCFERENKAFAIKSLWQQSFTLTADKIYRAVCAVRRIRIRLILFRFVSRIFRYKIILAGVFRLVRFDQCWNP
jgi:hypothetical protein